MLYDNGIGLGRLDSFLPCLPSSVSLNMRVMFMRSTLSCKCPADDGWRCQAGRFWRFWAGNVLHSVDFVQKEGGGCNRAYYFLRELVSNVYHFVFYSLPFILLDSYSSLQR